MPPARRTRSGSTAEELASVLKSFITSPTSIGVYTEELDGAVDPPRLIANKAMINKLKDLQEIAQLIYSVATRAHACADRDSFRALRPSTPGELELRAEALGGRRRDGRRGEPASAGRRSETGQHKGNAHCRRMTNRIVTVNGS